MRKLTLVLSLPVLLLSAHASAHFNLDMPPTPAGSVDGKGAPPCGPDTADGVVTPVTGGTDLMIAVNETIDHGGFYRVALSLTNCKKDPANGPKCFPADNKVYDSKDMALNPTGPGTSDHADYDTAPKFPILGDHLFAHALTGTPKKYMGTVPLPNVSCDRCTLQVIEFMEKHGPNGSAGYFYHHCADLKITADPNKPLFDPNNMGNGGSGGSGMGGAAGAAGAGGTSGGTPGGGMAGMAGMAMSGGGAGGSGGAPGTAGTATSAGTGTTAAGTSSGGGTSNPGSSGSADDGSCGVAKRSRGSASALAGLGLLLGFVRRRRSRQ
jgi:hypothetical protein